MIVKNWLALSGDVSVENGTITYNPVEYQTQGGTTDVLASLTKSDTYFDNGEIDFTVIFNEEDAICQLVLNHDNDPWIAVGSNSGSGLWEILKVPNAQQSETLDSTGSGSKIKIGIEYHIKVSVIGSVISLFVNNISVLKVQQTISKSQLAIFFHSTKQIVVTDVNVTSIKPKAFVVMQFSPEYNNLYHEVIRPIVES